eukprot:968192-Pyramimonas_sp.AAC.1
MAFGQYRHRALMVGRGVVDASHVFLADEVPFQACSLCPSIDNNQVPLEACRLHVSNGTDQVPLKACRLYA